jgi:DNA-binding IscR family transcriptional regulator
MNYKPDSNVAWSHQGGGVMRLQMREQYAICIMAYLADTGRSAWRTVASKLGIDEYNFAQIIKTLENQKWVMSISDEEDVGLIEDPENITLFDIIQVIKDTEEDSIQLKDGYDKVVTNSMNNFYEGYQQCRKEYFSSVTLADLLRKGEYLKNI